MPLFELISLAFLAIIVVLAFFLVFRFSNHFAKKISLMSASISELKARQHELHEAVSKAKHLSEDNYEKMLNEIKQVEEQLLVLVKQRKKEIEQVSSQVGYSIRGLEKTKQVDKKIIDEVDDLERQLNSLLKEKQKEKKEIQEKFSDEIGALKKKQLIDKKQIEKYLHRFEKELRQFIKRKK